MQEPDDARLYVDLAYTILVDEYVNGMVSRFDAKNKLDEYFSDQSSPEVDTWGMSVSDYQ